MRRKQGKLISIEIQIISTIKTLSKDKKDIYGFSIAKYLKNYLLASRGTIYRALARLENMGYLKSNWEIPNNTNNHPRKKFYSLIGEH
jgi:DNA-binding PadR family transcriptional regulator